MTKKRQNPISKTIKEYAENTTIHGIQYIFENGSSVFEKFSWILVVLIGAIFAAILSLQGFQKWKNNLILTTVETTAYPIEKVEFPAITICAQGMKREIVDAALFQQFMKYMIEKKANESKTTQTYTDSADTQRRRKRETNTEGDEILKNLTMDEMKEEKSNFLQDKFPGIGPKGLPTNLVDFMSAPSPDIVMESHALVHNPAVEKQTCANGMLTFGCPYGYEQGIVRLKEEKTPEVMWKGKWTPICGHAFWNSEHGPNLFCQKLDSKYKYGKFTKRTDKLIERDAIWIGKCRSEDDWLSCTEGCNNLEIGGECIGAGSCSVGGAPSMEIECSSAKQISTPDNKIFEKFMPLGNSKSIIFTVKAGNGAHLCLDDESDDHGCVLNDSSDNAYIIVIGSLGNTGCNIRRNWAEKVSLTQIGCKLDANKDREFWADFNTGLIRLGQGHVLGQNILLEWQDPNPIVPIVVRFMTGWGATGLWNVKLGSPSKRKRRAIENAEPSTTSTGTKSVIERLDILLDPEKEETRKDMEENIKKEFYEHFGNMSMTESYESLFQLLWYSQLPCFDVKQITSTKIDEMSFIKKCSWKGKEISCPDIFEMQPTDRGMCCSFNMEKAERIFQKSKYTEVISKYQKEAFDNRFQNLNKGLPIKEPKSQPGLNKGLQLVLDAHSDKISIGSVFDSFKGFVAVVGNKNEYPLTKKHGFLLQAGQENYVSLSATNIEADENIRPIEISPGKRECYFNDEHPLKLHQNYSQANCIIECTIQFAREQMKSKCTPWYYPVSDEEAKMCDPWETLEFINHTEQIPDDHCNKCLSDCNSTIYHVTVSSAPFKICDHTNLQTSKMCKLTSGDQINPPSWTTEVNSQYFDCFDHGEDYVIKDTCIDNTVENCPKTNNAKVCEPSSTENVDNLEEPGYPKYPDVKCLGVNVATAKNCQLKCQEDADCKYWSWNTNEGKQHCIGKNSQGEKRISASFVSGPKQCELPKYIEEPSHFSSKRNYIQESKIPYILFPNQIAQNPTYNAYEEDISIVNFYFDKSSIFKFVREENMTLVDYIAQLGGFFGLGIGLSMLSCIELIYWLTIRLCKNMKNRQVDTDLGPPELDVTIVSKPNTPSPPSYKPPL